MPMDRVSFTSLNRIMHIKDAQIQDSGTYMCTITGPYRTSSKNITVSLAGMIT
jgi:hypothetical protein